MKQILKEFDEKILYKNGNSNRWNCMSIEEEYIIKQFLIKAITQTREETIREVESETSKIPKIEMTLSDITDMLNCLSKRIEEIKILNKLKK